MLEDQPSIGYQLKSLLDTDLYKLTMQQAVLSHFPEAQATYRFTHRDNNVYFTRSCIDEFESALSHFKSVALTNEELKWLTRNCSYLKPEYLSYLSSYRFKPEQVSIQFKPVTIGSELGDVEIEAMGPWVETIMWEVPLMACLSETYFRFVSKDWNYEKQAERAYEKATALLQAGCTFSEFGTRRRRSFHIQDLVVSALIRASQEFPTQGKFSGTSNVYLAYKYDLMPIGTIAHEWFMGVAALRGYEHANSTALDLWEQVYPSDLLVALTDTFSTEVFYKEFITDKNRAKRWKGLRQDSGDPFIFVPRAKEVYESLGINYREKSIIFSDAVHLDKALALKKQCDDLGFVCSFGIGTFLTNDFYTVSSGGKDKSKALNMVIKLGEINGKQCVKISDELTKNTGDNKTVLEVKKLYGIL
ncbi:hypothetical protein SERLA73DRAFT_108274 [Serpula lacrymans var. lacrymans S7.3]|uniref:Nicotinate phosphoribosyltransferase n=2 Tax=Serpula lacrymans var. lacrymans TaxID=341189 RepID=F8PYP1_SERL3|nr:uncharacterized protein SERLADRAFT_349296 [Serpula lacrymans var. lacrymans S7.9]EGN99004.1 hypothetical protein SERLA73DRAFT_108274 [Serpula lacrymans var. lacrymans S7.3]EGO24588.1 hypothetical protein SERLADRAFT_349296 [Serpula lacrymans var. lacrymans S7.9]